MAILRKGIAKGMVSDHGGWIWFLIILGGEVLKKVSV